VEFGVKVSNTLQLSRRSKWIKKLRLLYPAYI